jgi:hypothetical protein
MKSFHKIPTGKTIEGRAECQVVVSLVTDASLTLIIRELKFDGATV